MIQYGVAALEKDTPSQVVFCAIPTGKHENSTSSDCALSWIIRVALNPSNHPCWTTSVADRRLLTCHCDTLLVAVAMLKGTNRLRYVDSEGVRDVRTKIPAIIRKPVINVAIRTAEFVNYGIADVIFVRAMAHDH